MHNPHIATDSPTSMRERDAVDTLTHLAQDVRRNIDIHVASRTFRGVAIPSPIATAFNDLIRANNELDSMCRAYYNLNP